VLPGNQVVSYIFQGKRPDRLQDLVRPRVSVRVYVTETTELARGL
jgi:hypothetical protein